MTMVVFNRTDGVEYISMDTHVQSYTPAFLLEYLPGVVFPNIQKNTCTPKPKDSPGVYQAKEGTAKA